MTPPNPNSWAKSCIHPGIWGPRKPSMKSSPICNSIRYCSPADPMVPRLSDLSTNVKDRSPDEPIARGASESSRFQDYSAAGLDVVRCTRIAPEIVLAAATHEFVRQLPLAPQFGDELRVQDRMCLRSDRTAAVSCTYPVHEHGLVARVPNGKRRCDRVTQETGTAYQE